MFVCIYAHVREQVFVRVCFFVVSACVCACKRVLVCGRVCLCMCACVSVRARTFVYVCVCISTDNTYSISCISTIGL